MDDKRGRRRTGMRFAMCGCGIIATMILIVGCADERPKPMAQPSSGQVKGDADRAFDRLKQEERDRKPTGM